MKKALIVDDHPVVRNGLKNLLEIEFPKLIIEESSGSEGTVQEVCGYPWAFVILDINLPDQNGLVILKKARTFCPNVPIIVFSLFSERQYAARAVKAGAFAYLSKECPTRDLLDAVRMALRGERAKKPRGTIAHPALSDREIQVLGLIVKGLSRKEIAQHLGINEKTVSTYRARLLVKLNVQNLVELVRYAMEEGLVE